MATPVQDGWAVMRIGMVLGGIAGGAGGGAGGQSGCSCCKPKCYVVYAAEQQVVEAGKKSVLELQFQVGMGFM